MQVAALYDIHGNLPALEAVLAELEPLAPDLVLVGGDAVLGPFPCETLELLSSLGERVRFIRGNTEREILDPDAAQGGLWGERAAWVAAMLTADDRRFLAALPEAAVIEVDGLGPALFCHGSPRGDDEILTAITPERRLRPILAGLEQDIVVCGHTHVQFDRAVSGIRLVNAGSVGMPYEREPGAYWALLGPGVDLRRTAYDVGQGAERIRASGFPEAEEFADEYLLSRPSPEEATEHFERIASRAR